MERSKLLIGVVDDNEAIRESLPHLLETFGFMAQAFAAPHYILTSPRADDPACLIVDIAMPGMSELVLHAELVRQGRYIPVVFISARAQDFLPMLRAHARLHGVAPCLAKPFSAEDIIEAVCVALGGLQIDLRPPNTIC